MKDQWLTDIVGGDCYTLAPDLQGVAEYDRTRRRGGRFFSVKVPTADVVMAQEFEDQGFRIVDTAVTLVRPAMQNAVSVARDVHEAREEDFSALVDIAESAFCSRFHLDPQIAPATASAIKRAWIGSYFTRDRGDRLFVHKDRGQPGGFLGSMLGAWKGQTAWIIDLIAVAPYAQGQCVGTRLVGAHLGYFPALCSLVGTQASNVASLALYSKMGFRIAKTEFVLHAHCY